MTINIKGTGISVTPEISDYLHKRLEGIDKFLPQKDGGCMVDVELGRSTNHHHTGDVCRAEINVHIGGKIFRAVSEQQDLYSAIDEIKDALTRELASYKEKRLSLIRRSGLKLKNFIRKFYK